MKRDGAKLERIDSELFRPLVDEEAKKATAGGSRNLPPDTFFVTYTTPQRAEVVGDYSV